MGLKLSGVEDAAEWIRHMVKMARAYGRIEGVRMSGIEGFGDDEIEAGPPLPAQPPTLPNTKAQLLAEYLDKNEGAISEALAQNVHFMKQFQDLKPFDENPKFYWDEAKFPDVQYTWGGKPLKAPISKSVLATFSKEIAAQHVVTAFEEANAKGGPIGFHAMATQSAINKILNYLADNVSKFFKIVTEDDPMTHTRKIVVKLRVFFKEVM